MGQARCLPHSTLTAGELIRRIYLLFTACGILYVKQSRYEFRDTKIHWPDIFLTRILALQLTAWERWAHIGCLNMLYCCDGIQINNVIDVRMHISRRSHAPLASLVYPTKHAEEKKKNESEQIVILFILYYLLVGTSSNFIILFRSFCAANFLPHTF